MQAPSRTARHEDLRQSKDIGNSSKAVLIAQLKETAMEVIDYNRTLGALTQMGINGLPPTRPKCTNQEHRGTDVSQRAAGLVHKPTFNNDLETMFCDER
ncbi:hypothetical protein N7517_005338 [Penicillium concentricum]|uniref:Uncharacterized protein n=1 Tax=Penicillium concentricum TaxID=293559 RepID=A0A9W9V939_9EURO|nr:uncharacterized protein N7517_005338 [Penicillium concentricum]KAJ5373332.1 hypothetical protein N7517_005338 [Penicillium concentricum]